MARRIQLPGTRRYQGQPTLPLSRRFRRLRLQTVRVSRVRTMTRVGRRVETGRRAIRYSNRGFKLRMNERVGRMIGNRLPGATPVARGTRVFTRTRTGVAATDVGMKRATRRSVGTGSRARSTIRGARRIGNRTMFVNRRTGSVRVRRVMIAPGMGRPGVGALAEVSGGMIGNRLRGALPVARGMRVFIGGRRGTVSETTATAGSTGTPRTEGGTGGTNPSQKAYRNSARYRERHGLGAGA